MKRTILLLSILLASCQLITAQCCSPGNPVSGSEHTGTLPGKTLRTITFYRHSFSDTYYEVSDKSSYQGSRAGYDFIGEVISYGFMNRLAVDAELGYYFNKFQDSDVLGKFTTHGFSNAVLSVKYAVLKTKKGLEVTVGSGIKMPIFHKTFTDEYGVPYTQDIQPSTGAFGYVGQVYALKSLPLSKMRLVFNGRYEHNGYNNDDYRFGDALITSLFIGRTITMNWSAVIQLRNEYRWEDFQSKTRYLATGGDIIFVSPQISHTFKNKMTVSASTDLPVYRKYNGIQLGPKYAFGISLVKDFRL
ncbi:MAG: hypothetical protein ACM3PX_02505 [Omnitrophica WOR_2 bacterium]